MLSAVLYQEIGLWLTQLSPVLKQSFAESYNSDYNLYQEKINELYTFPIKVSSKDFGKAEIFNIVPNYGQKELSYEVKYVTSLGKIENNNMELEEEAEKLSEEVRELFPSIEDGIGYFVFTAFEEMPKNSDYFNTYTTIIKVEKE